MTRGEEIRVLVDYDLFDVNIKNEIGVYIQTTPSNQKHLVYMPINHEWAELSDEQIERVAPDTISEENSDFVSRIQTMRITFETP